METPYRGVETDIMVKPEGSNMRRKSRQNQTTDGRKDALKGARVIAKTPKSAVALKQEAFRNMTPAEMMAFNREIKARAESRPADGTRVGNPNGLENKSYTDDQIITVIDATFYNNGRLTYEQCDELAKTLDMRVNSLNRISPIVTAIYFPGQMPGTKVDRDARYARLAIEREAFLKNA